MDHMQTASKCGVLHDTWTVGIPLSIAQRKHRPAERDLYGTIQHGLHCGVPLLEVRCGLVVFERRLVVVDFIKGKQRGVGLVLNDVEAAATGLVEDRAGGVGNRGLDKVVDVVLLGFETNHQDVHSTSLLAHVEAGLHVCSSIPGSLNGCECGTASPCSCYAIFQRACSQCHSTPLVECPMVNELAARRFPCGASRREH